MTDLRFGGSIGDQRQFPFLDAFRVRSDPRGVYVPSQRYSSPSNRMSCPSQRIVSPSTTVRLAHIKAAAIIICSCLLLGFPLLMLVDHFKPTRSDIGALLISRRRPIEPLAAVRNNDPEPSLIGPAVAGLAFEYPSNLQVPSNAAKSSPGFSFQAWRHLYLITRWLTCPHVFKVIISGLHSHILSRGSF